MLKTPTSPSAGGLLDVSFFAEVFRSSAIPTFILAPDDTVQFWNAAAERLSGWSSEEVLGRQQPLVAPEQMDEHRQLFRRAWEGEGFSQQRVTRRDKNGRTLELSLSTWPIRDADGRVTATIGIYADIRAEELRLRQSLAEKQLEEVDRLYATAPAGLGFLDTELRVVRVNELLARMNGVSVEGLVGKRLADFVPKVAESLEAIFRDVIATGVPLTDHELRTATPALPGVPRDWQVSAYPLKHPDGTVLGVTVAVSDITERKRWSEELQRQEALLRLVIDGYHVLLADNGQQAIAVLEAHPEVRAVVLDLIMGGDSAAPILHSLRPDVPLILTSGYSESYAVGRVGPGVVAAFLDKPYQPDALVAKLEEVSRSRTSN